jgi:hypothetical protein
MTAETVTPRRRPAPGLRGRNPGRARDAAAPGKGRPNATYSVTPPRTVTHGRESAGPMGRAVLGECAVPVMPPTPKGAGQPQRAVHRRNHAATVRQTLASWHHCSRPRIARCLGTKTYAPRLRDPAGAARQEPKIVPLTSVLLPLFRTGLSSVEVQRVDDGRNLALARIS